jgi:hypothetical protein
MNIQVNDSAGLSFALGMMDCANRMRKHKELFEDWIKSKGWDTWHLHDGWVRKNYRSGNDVIKSDRINLTWIAEHAESHSRRIPSKGQTVLIVDDFPGKPVLNVNLYRVTICDTSIFGLSDRMELSKLDNFTIHFKEGKFYIA